jgi:diaminopimelate epimerase
MEYSFVKMNPAGNTTILVTTLVPREFHKTVAKELMKDTFLCAEQVGFVEPAMGNAAVARLQMMGGEFCGNASRCFAAWLALGGLTMGFPACFTEAQEEIPIEVSGHSGVLTAKVINLGKKTSALVAIAMPLPISIRHDVHQEFGDLSLVQFEGIAHLIVWKSTAAADDNMARALIDYMIKSGLKNHCYGVMFYNEEQGSMVPAVYVREVESLIWENSCGSGTAALAAALADRRKAAVPELSVSQPGGSLVASALWCNGISKIELSGDISITAAGTVFMD